MKWLLLVGLLRVGATSCETPTAMQGGVWLDPVPAEYADDWRSVEACSGLTGDFATVRWVIYPDRLVVPGTRNLGQAHHDTRIIELGGRALAPIRRHEILHLLLGPVGDDHPVAYFVDRCGTLVSHD